MPLPGHDDPTDESVAFGWQRPPNDAADAVLHLVIAWFVGEPDRTGQVARLDRPSILGRASSSDATPELLRFTEERPGASLAVPPLTGTALSRRQLEIEPLPDRRVQIRCVGRRELLHNGAHVTECVAQDGDTLTLEDTAVFLVEADRQSEGVVPERRSQPPGPPGRDA